MNKLSTSIHSGDHFITGTLQGTVSGTLLTVTNIASQDLIKTTVLATLGAVVSFSVTIVLKYLEGRRKK